MATSHFVRAFQIFSGSGTIAVVPFATQFANKQSKISLGEDKRLMSEDSREEEIPSPQAPIEIPKKPSNEGENIIEKAIEKITETGEGAKKGGKGFGCFWAFSILEFLFCFDTESEETSPFLFHFSWKKGVRKKVEERLKMVDVIPHARTVQFKNGGSEEISLPSRTHFSWVWKFQPEVFMPSKHCKITNAGKQEDYKLICDTPQRTHTNPVWTKNVSQGQVVKPTISLQPKN